MGGHFDRKYDTDVTEVRSPRVGRRDIRRVDGSDSDSDEPVDKGRGRYSAGKYQTLKRREHGHQSRAAKSDTDSTVKRNQRGARGQHNTRKGGHFDRKCDADTTEVRSTRVGRRKIRRAGHFDRSCLDFDEPVDKGRRCHSEGKHEIPRRREQGHQYLGTKYETDSTVMKNQRRAYGRQSTRKGGSFSRKYSSGSDEPDVRLDTVGKKEQQRRRTSGKRFAKFQKFDVMEQSKCGEGSDTNLKTMKIVDATGSCSADLFNTINMYVMSGLQAKKITDNLLRFKLEPRLQGELCSLLLKCCVARHFYLIVYGEVAERLCKTNRRIKERFAELFSEFYEEVHNRRDNELRNGARFFAHLLSTNAIKWKSIECIHLTDAETTSSSRVYVKNIFQELTLQLGVHGLSDKISTPENLKSARYIFQVDEPNKKFAEDFFSAIGLSKLAERCTEKIVGKQSARDSESGDGS